MAVVKQELEAKCWPEARELVKAITSAEWRDLSRDIVRKGRILGEGPDGKEMGVAVGWRSVEEG